MSDSMTRQAAIAAKCRDCIFDPMAKGSWKEQIADCASSPCALHPFRPVPAYRGIKDRDARIREARNRLAA